MNAASLYALGEKEKLQGWLGLFDSTLSLHFSHTISKETSWARRATLEKKILVSKNVLGQKYYGYKNHLLEKKIGVLNLFLQYLNSITN